MPDTETVASSWANVVAARTSRLKMVYPELLALQKCSHIRQLDYIKCEALRPILEPRTLQLVAVMASAVKGASVRSPSLPDVYRATNVLFTIRRVGDGVDATLA